MVHQGLMATCDADNSSSEEEAVWQAASGLQRQRQQFLDADQLKLWRHILREEIEEDLEKQVRDRLGLDWFSHCSMNNHSPTGQERDMLYYSKKETKGKLKLSAAAPAAAAAAAPCSSLTEVTAIQEPIVMSNSTAAVQQPHTLTDRGQSIAVCNRSAEVYKPSAAVAVQRQKKRTLQDYVHSKYGVPMEQLSSVLTTGVVTHVEMDSSGCGRGPIIRAPVEASLLLPTPTHTSLHVTVSGAVSGGLEPSLTASHRSNLTTDHDSLLQQNGVNTATTNIPHNTLTPHSDTTHLHTLPTPHTMHTSHSASLRAVAPLTTELDSVTDGLKFEAQFECGNLDRAKQIAPFEYNLWLNFDLYSTKHTQWFYFRVEGMVAMTTYKFHIVNMCKPDSLYNYGMQVLLYSECVEALGCGGWRRVGESVCYTKSTQSQLHYTLSWNMEFPHTGDVCYLAHCYPYPYSRLLRVLSSLQESPASGRYITRDTLCTTIAGNDCPLLTITDYQGSADEREVVVVSARVHPGETNGSWIMEGLLDMLTADTPHAQALRGAYVFKIVPMLNPDGVIVGNYRTSLAGVDLNRVYKTPCPQLFPTVAATRSMVDQLLAHRKVLLYLDLHGHSRKHNVFVYGCHAPQSDHAHILQERLFPFLVSQQAPQMFSFASCKYSVERCKASTGRVVMWRSGVAHSFTVECSFCGSSLGGSPQFTVTDLLDMGRALGEAVYRLHKLSASKSTEQRVLGQLADEIMKEARINLPDIVTTSEPPIQRPHARRNSKKALKRFMKFDLSQITESSTSGSDSENDEFEFKEKKIARSTKRVRQRTVPHTHTQPLLPSLSTHSSQPSQRRKSIASVRSCVPLPQLVRNSAPPRLNARDSAGTTDTKHWRFVNKYKGRSNGGIPMFSEERLKERAEKRLSSSMSMFQSSAMANERGHPAANERGHPAANERGFPAANERGFPAANERGFPAANERGFPAANERGHPTANERGHPTATERGHPAANDRRKGRMLWQPGEHLKQARVQGSVGAKQPDAVQHYDVLRRQFLRQRELLPGQRERRRVSKLPPELAQFVRELWSNQ